MKLYVILSLFYNPLINTLSLSFIFFCINNISYIRAFIQYAQKAQKLVVNRECA